MANRTSRMNRRTALKGIAAIAAAPAFVPSTVFGQNAPSNRIVIGCIGVGGMGTGNMQSFLGKPLAQVVAVCDVDQQRAAEAKKKVDTHYKNEDCKAYGDFREIVARKDIDAVSIATPDHWHALCAIAAAESGKDIYCEKPITHNLAEGIKLHHTVAKHQRIWQTGSWQRSQLNFRLGAELVVNGVIGKLQHVEVGLPTGHKQSPNPADASTPPAHADYDFYCGPSPLIAFHQKRFHYDWRWHYNFGGGQMMDWIGHHNDIAHWGMGEDYGGPIEVTASEFEYLDDRTVWNAPHTYRVTCKYAGGYTSSLSNKHPMGTKWIGSDGWVFVDRGGKFETSNPEWKKKEFRDSVEKKLYDSQDHHANFLDCIKSRKPCITTAEISHRSITPGHLGLISEALGGKTIKWDPKAEKIVGDEAAAKLAANGGDAQPFMAPRKPWQI